jgi:PleD family two-component response regulator
MSTGIACYNPENPCSIDELMAEADQLMYEQKKSKKSCSI